MLYRMIESPLNHSVVIAASLNRESLMLMETSGLTTVVAGYLWYQRHFQCAVTADNRFEPALNRCKKAPYGAFSAYVVSSELFWSGTPSIGSSQ